MNHTDSERKHERMKALLRLSFGLIMILIGTLTVALTEGRADSWFVVERIGLAFIIAGVVGIFTELAFGYYWYGGRGLSSAPVLTGEAGMQMIRHERIGFTGFHKWILELQPQEMFFTGRSVLHRVKRDFEDRKLPSVADAFIQKMKTGSKIRVLFMNPMWDLIGQIAMQEGRGSAKELYSDLKITCSVVKELWEKLQSQDQNLPGSLEIRVYEEISQYSYHYVKNIVNGSIEMYVGFYFAQLLGWQSPLFDVQSKDIQKSFEEHFSIVFGRAQQILVYPSGGGGLQWFAHQFHEQAINHLESSTGGTT